MKDPVEKPLKAGVFIVFSALILVVTFQITSRIFFPNFSQIWTEEVTRFLFIYTIALAAPLAMKQGGYVNIDLINRLPVKLLIPIKLLISLLFISLLIILFIYGIQFTILGASQRAPTIKIPIAVVFVSIPLMGILMVYYAIINVAVFIQSTKTGGNISSWS